MTISERYAKRKQDRGKSTEELQLEQIKKQREEKQLMKAKTLSYFTKIHGTVSISKSSVIKQ